jgi:hypothetical protein
LKTLGNHSTPFIDQSHRRFDRNISIDTAFLVFPFESTNRVEEEKATFSCIGTRVKSWWKMMHHIPKHQVFYLYKSPPCSSFEKNETKL